MPNPKNDICNIRVRTDKTNLVLNIIDTLLRDSDIIVTIKKGCPNKDGTVFFDINCESDTRSIDPKG